MNRKKYFVIVMSAAFSILLFGFSTGSNNVLKDSLVGHWTFDGEGDIVIDNSDFESHGQLNGNPKIASGIVGKGCLELDGQGDFVEIVQNGETPSQLHNLAQGSISMWFKARSIPKGTSISPLFYYGNSTGCENMKDASNEGLVVEIAHGGISTESQGIYFTLFNSSCDYPTVCFDTHSDSHLDDVEGFIKPGEWYHFVAVVGENYNTGYLNGEEVSYRNYNFSSADASQFFSNALSHDRLWIGKGFWDYAKEIYFDGYVDDVRIYNVALNAKEVMKLYKLQNSN